MSKAFTKESDSPLDEVIPEPKDPLPEGVKNYVTPEGAELLRNELEHYEDIVRPRLVKEGKKRGSGQLEAADRRIQFLRDRVANMVVIDPKSQDQESVRFAATITVADEDGNEKTYQIVGVDESDPKAGKISWISPIAKALNGARVGDAVRVELPDATTELEVLNIEYR